MRMLTGAELDAVAGSGIWMDESGFPHVDGDNGTMAYLDGGVWSYSTTDANGYWTQYVYPNGDSFITNNGQVVWSN